MTENEMQWSVTVEFDGELVASSEDELLFAVPGGHTDPELENVTDTLDKDGGRVEGEPHLWIQWKGTDVCCDIHCKCGAHLHFDGDFLYAFQCPHCKQIYETGSHVPVYPVEASDHEPKQIEPSDDDFDD